MSLRNIFNSVNSTTIKDKLDEYVREGGDINELYGRDEQTYLMNLILQKKAELAKILIEYPKTKVNTSDGYGATALHAAASTPNMLPIVKLLIEKGAIVNAKDILGETPLHMAAFAGEKDYVEYLLEHGADKSIKNKNGQTAYNIAGENNYEGLYDLLRVEEPAAENNMSPINRNNNNVYNLNNRPQNNNQNRNTANNATVNFINTVQRRRNPFPKKAKNRHIVIKDTINVYDFEAAEEVPVTYNDALDDNINIYFKASNTYFRIPREVLQASVNEHANIQFECKKELHGAPKRENLVFNKPYYLIRGLANFLVPLDEVLGALYATAENSYMLKDAEEEPLKYVASYDSIIRDYTGTGLNGSYVNIMSSDHCQEGSTRRLYKLIPFYFVKDEPKNNNSNNNASNNNAPTNGGRRKRRVTKKLKRTKRSTRRRSKR